MPFIPGTGTGTRQCNCCLDESDIYLVCSTCPAVACTACYLKWHPRACWICRKPPTPAIIEFFHRVDRISIRMTGIRHRCLQDFDMTDEQVLQIARFIEDNGTEFYNEKWLMDWLYSTDNEYRVLAGGVKRLIEVLRGALGDEDYVWIASVMKYFTRKLIRDAGGSWRGWLRHPELILASTINWTWTMDYLTKNNLFEIKTMS